MSNAAEPAYPANNEIHTGLTKRARRLLRCNL
jgi:hypothetical protein